MTSDESTPWRAHGLPAHDLSLTCPWCAPQVQLSWDADESERTQVMKRDFTKGELREQARDSPRSAETLRDSLRFTRFFEMRWARLDYAVPSPADGVTHSPPTASLPPSPLPTTC